MQDSVHVPRRPDIPGKVLRIRGHRKDQRYQMLQLQEG